MVAKVGRDQEAVRRCGRRSLFLNCRPTRSGRPFPRPPEGYRDGLLCPRQAIAKSRCNRLTRSTCQGGGFMPPRPGRVVHDCWPATAVCQVQELLKAGPSFPAWFWLTANSERGHGVEKLPLLCRVAVRAKRQKALQTVIAPRLLLILCWTSRLGVRRHSCWRDAPNVSGRVRPASIG
jgi:hypothetical protein